MQKPSSPGREEHTADTADSQHHQSTKQGQVHAVFLWSKEKRKKKENLEMRSKKMLHFLDSVEKTNF